MGVRWTSVPLKTIKFTLKIRALKGEKISSFFYIFHTLPGPGLIKRTTSISLSSRIINNATIINFVLYSTYFRNIN